MTTSPAAALEDTVRALAAPLSDAELVRALQMIGTLEDRGVPAATVDAYRLVLTDMVEQRIDGVESAVDAWFDARPFVQGTTRQYADAVVGFARERLDG